jgi:hypothetical protein
VLFVRVSCGFHVGSDNIIIRPNVAHVNIFC